MEILHVTGIFFSQQERHDGRWTLNTSCKIFTSDLHIGHKSITKPDYTKRGLFTTAEEHDEWIKQIWNDTVKPGDVVYHLGDFSFYKQYDALAKYVSELKGEKIFIKGNHDDRKMISRLVEDKLISAFYEYKEIKIQDKKTVLFHNPITCWTNQQHGSMHLHGHCHGSLKDPKGLLLDVGLDSYYDIFGKHGFFTEQDVLYCMQKFRTFYIGDGHLPRNEKIIETVDDLKKESNNWIPFWFESNCHWGCVSNEETWGSFMASWILNYPNSDIYDCKVNPNILDEFGSKAQHTGSYTLRDYFVMNSMEIKDYRKT